MIIVKLKGGLGNQMFQYAFGRRLSLEKKVPLWLDLDWFCRQDKRQFDLGQFNIASGTVLMNGATPCSSCFSMTNLTERALRLGEKIFPGKFLNVIKEKNSGEFDPTLHLDKKTLYLDGYWQSEKYFKSAENVIRQEFSLKNSLSPADELIAREMRADPNSVSVHIRRGDYVADYKTMSIHYICTPDYYNETMKLVNKRLHGKAHFYVFSDDPEWCQSGVNYPSEYQIVSAAGRSPAEEIILMSMCRHAIISNSSYSWWGAWLINNPEKIVIYPKKWFNNKSTPDIAPESWIFHQVDSINDWKYIDIPYAKSRYREKFGQELDLENPQKFTEKIQWLKIYDRNPAYPALADKYAVRDYVAKKIGEKYLTELYGVYQTSGEIDWGQLPDRFHLKATHGCGWNIGCVNLKQLDVKKICQQLDDWLSKNYYYYGREWVYKDIQPRIIAEEYLEEKNANGLTDYKILCFNGQPKIVRIILDRFTDKKCAYYDLNWNKLLFRTAIPMHPSEIARPDNLDEMLDIARTLSGNIPFVRVDLYNPGNRIVFGEMTFYPGAGFQDIQPREYDEFLGKLLVLPCRKS